MAATRWATVTDENRLRQVRLRGSQLDAQLSKACVSASVSASMSSVTEIKMTFADDHDASLFRSGIFQPGMTLSYAHWRGRVRGGGRLRSAAGGPQVEVIAPSMFIERLKDRTGGATWGTVSVSSWVDQQAKDVGLRTDIQPGLGYREIVREAPDGDRSETTWDVITSIAEEVGAWVFEHSATLTMGKPEWLANRTSVRRDIPLRWDGWGDQSAALIDLPEFTPGDAKDQKLKVKIVGDDADRVRPGDTVTMKGRLSGGTREMNANGTWLISDVGLPLSNTKPVTLTCIRPVAGAL